MIRKQTLILIVVFALLLAGAFYLQKNPLPSTGNTTPTATLQPQLLPGINSSDITSITLKETQGSTTQVTRDAQGIWMMGSEGKQPADAGKAEQLRAEIAAAQVTAALPADYDAASLGLKEPAYILTVQTVAGKTIEFQIGSKTPTGSGYYVQIAGQPPVVINSGVVDNIISLVKEIQPTATPTTAPETEGTPQPTATP